MRKNRKNRHGLHAGQGIPTPPEIDRRQEQLPSERPKTSTIDPDIPKRIKALLESPNYRRADKDLDFLNEDAVRGIRLQTDYLKTELLLQQYGIEHTIAVFGGTRIVEKAEAQRNLIEAQGALEDDPQNELLQHKVHIARKILKKSHYYEIGREFGRIVGMSGAGPSDCRITLMTGGGPGVMEAANRGAYDVDAKSIGLNISLPREQYPNPYISPELCFQFHYFSMRKLHFMRRAKALVAFPGGYGTLDEILEALTLVQTRKMPPFPIILVGEEYWEKVIDFDFLLDEGVIDHEDTELFWYAESAEEIWEGILLWHRKNDTPLM